MRKTSLGLLLAADQRRAVLLVSLSPTRNVEQSNVSTISAQATRSL